MKYCSYCKKEVRSKGEATCHSACGANCHDCCSECGRHGLIQGTIAVIEGKYTNPSWGLQMLVNDIKAGMREVDAGNKTEFVCSIEDGRMYQGSALVNYTVKFRYTNGHYTYTTMYSSK